MTGALDSYRLLGRSGLRVSPLALGGASFGTEWGYGADRDTSRRIFDAYVDAGGNFIDTANVYTNGTSETLIGEFAAGRRERLVIATKYGGTLDPLDANSSGAHRRNMVRSVEDSLRRLGTDYIDLLYLHAWDGRTHPDEIMKSFDTLIASGKVLYAGISDTPAWQVARMQTMADFLGWAPIVALQLEYSLIQRDAERELLPLARALGIGVTAWWSLAGGILTGKYTRGTAAPDTMRSPGMVMASLSDRNLKIARAVDAVADQVGCSSAAVALAWVLSNPAVAAPLLGARSPEQLVANLECLKVKLTADQLAELETAAEFSLGFPHDMLNSAGSQQMFVGAQPVEARF